MKGRAPNDSCTGSQSVPLTKGTRPTLASTGWDRRANTNTMRPAITRMEPPTPPRSTDHTRSPIRPRRSFGAGADSVTEGATALSGASEDGLSIDRQCLERGLDLLDHGGRQGRVVEPRGRLLPVVGGPPEELDQRLALGRVLLVLVDEDVGEAGDGIGVLPMGVGDRHPEVGRHLHAGGRGGGAGDARCDEGAVVVLERGGGQLVLLGIGE